MISAAEQIFFNRFCANCVVRRDGDCARCLLSSARCQTASSARCQTASSARCQTASSARCQTASSARCPPSRPSPASRGRRRCNMQLQYSHVAASSSPIYGGGLRWGTNGLAFIRIEGGQTTSSARCQTASSARCPPSRPSPAPRGRRRCHMQLQYSHVAASSSPMYGGGLRWGHTTPHL